MWFDVAQSPNIKVHDLNDIAPLSIAGLSDTHSEVQKRLSVLCNENVNILREFLYILGN